MLLTDSEAEFHDALGTLVSEATSKDVDVTGARDVYDVDGERSGWTIEINKFATRS